MTMKINTALQNQLADSMGGTFDSGTLEIRSGAQPADANAADAGTLLATISLPADCMAAAASGVASKSGTWSATVSTSGTAAHGRFKNSGNTKRMDVAVGVGSGELQLDNNVLVAGGTVTVNTFTMTQPAT